MNLSGQTILILSNEPWGDIWYSKQNYAYELSKKNTVYFINPPKHWKSSNLYNNPITETLYNPSLHIIDYQNFLPIVNKPINLLNNYLVSKYLLNFLQKKGIKDFIFWSFDPVRLYDPSLFKPKISIYHCVDLFSFLFIGEAILCKKSDFIIANSQILLDNFLSFRKPMKLISHGISGEEFEPSDELMKKFDITNKNYGLYIGVIDLRIDYDWVEKALINHPETDFVFVGPIKIPKNNPAAVRIFEEKLYKNLFAIGPRHFKLLKIYIKNARFCISFMDENYPGNTIAHHKTLVYLAQGKPVFGYKFSEYKDLDELMYMSTKSFEVLEMLNSFLIIGESDKLIDKRRTFARKYSFEEIFKDIESFISDKNMD